MNYFFKPKSEVGTSPDVSRKGSEAAGDVELLYLSKQPASALTCCCYATDTILQTEPLFMQEQEGIYTACCDTATSQSADGRLSWTIQLGHIGENNCLQQQQHLK